MATTYTDRFSKVDLPNPPAVSGTYKKVQTNEGDKICLRLPSNVNYNSGVFLNLIHFTITLKIEER